MSHQETQTILPFSAISAFMAASSSTQEVLQPEMEFSGAGKNVQEVLNVVGEDFPIDTFLDFSNDDDELFDEEEKKEVGLSPENQTLSNSSDSGETVDVPAFVESELSVPAEELADLEWLSFFVEDSNYSGASAWPENSPGTSFPAPNRGFPMNTRIPCKTRSKRIRTGRIWSYRDGLSDSCSSSSTSSSSSSPLVLANLFRPVSGGVSVFLGGKPPKSHIRGRKPPENFGAVRRCTHCLVQKTPQWRAGPLGPKTLCNACGVRFKSGRLLPEYRPAGSPTFLNDVHSNNHRKVLEMRRRKEQVIPAGNMMAVESC